MAHAVLVQATVPCGRILSLEAAAALACPGVLAVYSDASFRPGLPPIGPPPEQFSENFPAERRAPFSDPCIHYAGQHIALVAAETLEQARQAAALVHVEYEQLPATLHLAHGLPGTYAPDHFATNSLEKLNSSRGTPPLGAAAVEQLYRTPVVHHNPIEPSATVASWEGDRLTLHDATRWVQGSQKVVAHMLGIPAQNVRVLAPFVGGAFGSKGFLWQHAALCAQAARALGRPVRLVLTRPQMFTSVGHRPETRQQVRLWAAPDGTLTGVEHDTLCDTSPVARFVEPCGMTARNLYRTSYARIAHRVAPLHRATPCFMRAPGESSGMWALETAMDELAVKLGIDPVALRLRNDTPEDLDDRRPFSSRHLRECLLRGAELFGWGGRSPKPQSMRREGKYIGWGMATAAYPVRRSPASVEGVLSSDGTAGFSAATHELGCGTATALTQVAAEALGWAPARVRFTLGDSQLSEAPVAGASQTIATMSPAVDAAARQLRAALLAAAVRDPHSLLFGAAADKVRIADGMLQSGARQEAAAAVLRRLPARQLRASARTEPGSAAKENFTFHSFGAHFCEVTWDPQIAELRVRRWTSVLDCGRVLNKETSRSQIRGGILFGLGMALMEETHYDGRDGSPVNNNLSEYHLPTSADQPEFTIEFVEEPDYRLNPLGVRGVGEIGITGAAAALGNAIFHASGARLRELPMTADKILPANR